MQHEVVIYNCDQCSYKGKTKGQLKQHVESIHEGVSYNCDQCSYKGNTKGQLKQHIESHLT